MDGDNLEAKVKQLEEDWKRALADYRNLEKRFDSEKRDVIKMASFNVMVKLIPVLDILEMAAAHSQDAGIAMAVKQFKQVLAEEGLEEIAPAVGDTFDHNLHECTETIEGDLDGTLASLVLKGYKLGDYIVRHAKVTVYKKTN
jgi:molecular chaperone GrpE